MRRTRLILVRHGESTWNAEGRMQGQADPPLSEVGRTEARALAAPLARVPIDGAVTSDLMRARETASLLGHPDAVLDPQWREIELGPWTSRLIAEIREESGDDIRAWRAGLYSPDGAETWQQFAARVSAAAERVAERGGTWLVVAHGGPIRVAAAVLGGEGEGDPGAIPRVGNCSVTVLERDGDGWRSLAYGAGAEALAALTT